jgi:hypothetical protein
MNAATTNDRKKNCLGLIIGGVRGCNRFGVMVASDPREKGVTGGPGLRLERGSPTVLERLYRPANNNRNPQSATQFFDEGRVACRLGPEPMIEVSDHEPIVASARDRIPCVKERDAVGSARDSEDRGRPRWSQAMDAATESFEKGFDGQDPGASIGVRLLLLDQL